MKKKILKITLGMLISIISMSSFAGGPDMPLPMTMLPGVYIGVGESWNTTQKQYNSTFSAADAAGVIQHAYDNFVEQQNKLAPSVNLGYWGQIDDEWLWGFQIAYKYLNFESNGYGISLPGATALLQSAAFTANDNTQAFARDVVQNELLLLVYFGYQFTRSYFYIGGGASWFTLQDTFGLVGSSNGFQSYAVQKYKSNKNTWGWAVQLGYNYYISSTWFWSLNYTYAQSGKATFTNTATRYDILDKTTAVVNPEGSVSVGRSVKFANQELIFSINKIFSV